MPELERIRSTLARIAEPVALLESLFGSAPAADLEPCAGAGDFRGLGLGLHLVQQIARAPGGDVRLDGANGRTVFRATLQR
jgi:signal transduction histidine kinase